MFDPRKQFIAAGKPALKLGVIRPLAPCADYRPFRQAHSHDVMAGHPCPGEHRLVLELFPESQEELVRVQAAVAGQAVEAMEIELDGESRRTDKPAEC